VINKLLDPIYFGYTKANDFRATMKCCIKRDASESVGVVAKKNGAYDIVEYSELTEEQANKINQSSGELMFNLGNILIFIFKTDKLIELCQNTENLNKLYHKAIKKVQYWDEAKNATVKPTSNNGYKFELFIHNFLPFCDAGKFGVLRVQREDEFAPVKNAEGAPNDSPNTARELIYN